MAPQNCGSYVKKKLNTPDLVHRLAVLITQYTLLFQIFTIPNLRVLSLKDNSLRSLPADIGRLVKLQSLILSHNRLKNESIPYTLSFCTELNTLLLDGNSLGESFLSDGDLYMYMFMFISLNLLLSTLF